MRKTGYDNWRFTRLSFDVRLAIFFVHRTPRGGEHRRQMAHCLRKILGRTYDQSVIDMEVAD